MAEELHIVTFRVSKELFGVPIATVQEIVRVPAIVGIPQSPKFVEGVINLRGRIITVIDMNKRLGHKSADDASPRDSASRILVVEAGGRLVGVIVDSVAEVVKIARDLVDAAPPMIAGISNQYINGIGKLKDDLLILIDMNKILSAEQLATLDEIQPMAA